MNPVSRGLKTVLCTSMAGVAFAGPAIGDDVSTPEEDAPTEKLDLTFHREGDPDTWLRPNVRIDTAWFAEDNPWGGNDKEIIGQNTDYWMELGIVPGLDAQISLGDYGKLSGRLSAVFTTTQLGLDAAGSNLGPSGTTDPKEITLEDLYVRWTSGELVPSLGTDALDLSVGALRYDVGTEAAPGFIFGNGGPDGGSRGGWWLGLRNANKFAVIPHLQTGGFMAEGVFLIPNEKPSEDTHTKVAGANTHYDFGEHIGLETARLGLGYWNFVDSGDTRRDGLDVVNLRGDITPIPGKNGLRLTSEMVREDNGSENNSWGAYGQAGYDFAAHECTWSPYLSYRYVYFSGDNQKGDNDAFDPLYYGFSDWNTWYLGEISGEFITGNSNFSAQVVRVRANPLESVTTQIFWIYQRGDELQTLIPPPGGHPTNNPRSVLIEDKDLSHELDFIVDWAVNDYLSTSAVAAVLIPLAGGKDYLGTDKIWSQYMLFASVKF